MNKKINMFSINMEGKLEDEKEEHEGCLIYIRHYKKLRSELEEAKKDMQITRDTEEEINNKLLGKNSDLQKENAELKKKAQKSNDCNIQTNKESVKHYNKNMDLKKQLSELKDGLKRIRLFITVYDEQQINPRAIENILYYFDEEIESLGVKNE